MIEMIQLKPLKNATATATANESTVFISSHSVPNSIPKYKIEIHDRNYNSWKYSKFTFDESREPENEIDLIINPIEYRLFNDDIFIINSNNLNNLNNLNNYKYTIFIINSKIRTAESIQGVLVLNNNKTYGRHTNGKGKLLYKCIPYDARLPYFMVPYEIKNMGFSKVFINLYITFQFKEWAEKHPVGVLNQVIGPINDLVNYYEYQLFCKGLNISINGFTKDTIKSLKNNYTDNNNLFIENIKIKYGNIQDRTDPKKWQIFTIDPTDCLDFDDAFSICPFYDVKTGKNDGYCVSIYISNVSIYLDALCLWNSFSNRISTIYLPDKKRSMLPPVLSDGLCSLQSKKQKIAFTLDVFISDAGEILYTKYSNSVINVFKNFCYEEPDLLSNTNYVNLLKITKLLTLKHAYISSVKDSHDVVSYFMILMNHLTAKELLINKCGIFRTTILKDKLSDEIITVVPDDTIAEFLKIWNNNLSAKYVNVEDELKTNNNLSHDLLHLDSYTHITSPIRRIVDLLNMIKFQQTSNIIELSENAATFYNKWLINIEYINEKMNFIKHIQNDSSLLHLCTTNAEIMSKLYEGYVFEKKSVVDVLNGLNGLNGLNVQQLCKYKVYLPELKIVSTIITNENLINFTKYDFKLFLFHNEEKFKKKIRLQLV